MSDKPKILMIVTLDTKPAEAQFLRRVLEEHGAEVFHLDASIRSVSDGGAEIKPEHIAKAAGTTMEAIRALNHEGQCQALMTEGAVECALALDKDVHLSAIIALGGSMGTSLATTVMRRFPYGLPKVMISTMASGFTKPFVGSKDIIMVNSVCDISGLNSITRSVYRNGATAAVGMARDYRIAAVDTRPLVLISTLGTTEKCSATVRESLEVHGFEVMVFHTLGTGGMVLDEIARDKDVAAVVDLSLVEINDYLNQGLCSAGPDRCKAALAKGIPTIFAPGNTDFMVAGPLDDAQARFPGKRYHVHNMALTAVRTEAPELRRLAEHMAGLIGEAKGPVAFYVPLKGFSAHDSEQGHLHEPSLPPVFASFLKELLPKSVPVVEIPHHINDEQFARAITMQVLAYTEANLASV
ncbi:MAG: Tm-1-like ATP-binding domain-containing protein [Pseudomonadota bacterium]